MYHRVLFIVMTLTLAAMGPFLLLPSTFPPQFNEGIHSHQQHHVAFAQSIPCWPFSTPLGALPPAVPIWCSALNSGPATFVQNTNSWLDDWNHGLSNASIGAGYQVFEAAGSSSVYRAQHFRHNDHWMVDIAGRDQTPGDGPYDLGGSTMRPDRAFRFVNGMLVIEADVAAGITEYNGTAWPELIVTTAPTPTYARPTSSGIYNYDQFPNHYTLGCRLQDSRMPICAFFDNTDRGPGNGGRIFEISAFQNGTSAGWGSGATYRYGGDPSIDNLGQAWRLCAGTDPDLTCRDRFRWEISKDRFVIYVNGIRYMEHSGFPAAQQLPDAFVNEDVYVYFGSWIFKPGVDTVRFHWDHLAVNPAPSVCNPRPQVSVTTLSSGGGRLQVTISATTPPGSAPNRLVVIRFGEPRAATNALIDLPNAPPGATGSFTVNPPDGATQYVFYVRQATPGSGATVPLVVVDNCGDWPTMTGGGAGVFQESTFTGGNAATSAATAAAGIPAAAAPSTAPAGPSAAASLPLAPSNTINAPQAARLTPLPTATTSGAPVMRPASVPSSANLSAPASVNPGASVSSSNSGIGNPWVYPPARSPGNVAPPPRPWIPLLGPPPALPAAYPPAWQPVGYPSLLPGGPLPPYPGNPSWIAPPAETPSNGPFTQDGLNATAP